MSLSTATPGVGPGTLDSTEVEHIVEAAVRRLAMKGHEFYAPHAHEPQEPLTLTHRPSGREFTLEIRAFETTGSDG